MQLSRKRKYSKRRYSQRISNEFISKQLRKEWSDLKKAAKRDKVLREAKSGIYEAAKILLSLAAVGGIVTIAAVAPNAVGAAARSWNKRSFFDKRTFQKASHYLKRLEYAKITKIGEGEYKLTITNKGMEKVVRKVLNGFQIPKPSRWDGWWRIVVFDISNKHKSERDIFRAKLCSLGFYKFQRSVFVFPYPCEKELGILISLLNINSYVNIIKAKEISSDDNVRKYFDL